MGYVKLLQRWARPLYAAEKKQRCTGSVLFTFVRIVQPRLRPRRQQQEEGPESPAAAPVGAAGRHRRRGRRAVLYLAAGGGAAPAWQAEAQEQQNAENMALSQDTIYEGVSINGIALGGMTKEEAVSAVEAGLGLAEHTLTLSYEEKTYPVPLLTGSDLASVVEEAYQVGRSGTREENLATIEGLAASPVNFTVEAGYSLPGHDGDPGRLRRGHQRGPGQRHRHGL